MSGGHDSTESLRRLAAKLENNREFMAHVLATYRKLEGLDEDALARKMGTLPELVVRLALCRRPKPHSMDLEDSVRELSDFTLIDESVLIDILREADAAVEHGALARRRTLSPNSASGRVAKRLGFALPFMTKPGLVYLTAIVAAGLVVCTLLLWKSFEHAGNGPAGEAQQGPVALGPSATGRPGEASANKSGPSASANDKQAVAAGSMARSRGVPLARVTVKVDLDDTAHLRDAESNSQEKILRLRAVRTRFLLTLPEGSARGAYSVSVVDAYANPQVTRRGTSVSGKTLGIVLDLRGLTGRYRLCVSREGEAPDCYPVVVGWDRVVP